MIVDINKFNNILAREANKKAELDPHTLDWYTYDNRVSLLKEVMDTFKEPKQIPAVEIPTSKKVKEAKSEHN